MIDYNSLMPLAMWLIIALQVVTLVIMIVGCRGTKSSFVKAITFPRLKNVRRAPISTQESGHNHFGYY